MAIKKVAFYNGFNNGDLHVSRQFVRLIANKLRGKYELTYLHKHNFAVLKDLKITQAKIGSLNRFGGDFVKGDTLYINTWYGTDKLKYMNPNGTSFGCLYALFDDVCKRRFKFALDTINKDPSKFFPKIDFSCYKTDHIDKWLKRKGKRKRILISNGKVLSGQTDNFPLYPTIEKLANRYHGIDFIITNKPLRGQFKPMNNLIMSSSIIQKGAVNDLNENAYIGVNCDAIVGKWSGTYTFSINQDNLFDRDMVFLCFLKRNHKDFKHTWIGNKFRGKIKYRADIIPSEHTRNDDVYNDINAICQRIIK